MAYSGPKSDRLPNDNKNDSISAPRHPSMSGHHLENYSSHHNKTDQFLLPNCPKPTQAVTTCMDYLFASSDFTPHLDTSTPIQTRVNHTTSLMQASIRFLNLNSLVPLAWLQSMRGKPQSHPKNPFRTSAIENLVPKPSPDWCTSPGNSVPKS
mgnify:CR=1 FL=1